MKIFQKILGMMLPIALISLFMGSWLTYSLSRQALDLMAERWLGTRLNEAVTMVTQHKEFLRLYGITNIRAGTTKAQFDAALELKSIQIGDHGYIYLLDETGTVVSHPDLEQVGNNISHYEWVKPMLQKVSGSISYEWLGDTHLGMFAFFKPWGWIIVATDPFDEIYGTMNHAKKYILALAVFGSMGISLLAIILVRRLVIPLQLLVQGTQRVGKGDLDVSIPIKSRDEIGHLSRAFNVMSHNLKQSLGALKQSEFRLQRLNSRLISAQEDERKRLSVELHDEVGQSLAVLKLKVIFLEEGLETGDAKAKKECEDMTVYIDQVIENVRRLSRDLVPSSIEDLGLAASLMWLADTIKKFYIIEADINLASMDDHLSLENQILIYRIFQEAISNTVKHSSATKIIMNGHHREKQLIFSIQDNGKGFDMEQIDSNKVENKGLGLPTMQERARMLGADFTIKSRMDSGTLLQFSVPIVMKESNG
ncbi:MAG: HAMP domain-containing protein [Desulfobacula sp.]|jgi:signal transduction histidine kinase|nr:HAMP domain-containing protein [Desulfobacula sp.]